jgi:hypothetical protein
MAVETALVPIGSLNPGASIASTVTITMASDAACGSAYGLLYGGAVDIYNSSRGQTGAIATLTMPAQCQAFTGSCATGQPKAAIVPRQGLFSIRTARGTASAIS